MESGNCSFSSGGVAFRCPLYWANFFRPEAFPGFVEGHQHVPGLDLLEQFQQHVAQSVYGAGIDTGFVGQRRQGKKARWSRLLPSIRRNFSLMIHHPWFKIALVIFQILPIIPYLESPV